MWKKSSSITNVNISSDIEISTYGTPLYGKPTSRLMYILQKFENNKPCLHLLGWSIETFKDVQKLVKKKECHIFVFWISGSRKLFCSSKKKKMLSPKNCLAKRAKAQSIVHILHICRRIPNWKRCYQNLKPCAIADVRK